MPFLQANSFALHAGLVEMCLQSVLQPPLTTDVNPLGIRRQMLQQVGVINCMLHGLTGVQGHDGTLAMPLSHANGCPFMYAGRFTISSTL